jgi:Flp pilus assembly protein TadB
MPLWVVCAITFVTILLIVLLAMLGPLAAARRESRLARLDELTRYRLVGPYAGEQDPNSPTEASADPAKENAFAARALAALDAAVRARGQRARLVEELERSGMRMKPEEWAAVQIAAVAGLAAVAAFVFGTVLVLPVGGALGWIGGRLFLAFKIKRRAAAFQAGLPDALQMLAGALRSGFALNQSIGAVVREGVEPVAGEFGRALQEVRLGAELDDALDAVGERMGSYDMQLVVMSIRTSREVGGNLAEVLETTVHTMRERVQLRGQVQVLSAEGRLAAKVLTALPILMAVYLRFFRPAYLRVMYTTGVGIAILSVGVVLLLVGSFWLSRLTKIEV